MGYRSNHGIGQFIVGHAGQLYSIVTMQFCNVHVSYLRLSAFTCLQWVTPGYMTHVHYTVDKSISCHEG